MSTALAKHPSPSLSSISSSEIDKKDVNVVVREVTPPLGATYQEKKFWFQRGNKHDPDAIATQVCLSELDVMFLAYSYLCISPVCLTIQTQRKNFNQAQIGKTFIDLTLYSAGKCVPKYKSWLV
jgi:hypothetical protein